ncbi:hypothetical protein KAU51_04380 [Candidatus Parcubacteria bacterium]|nr:hypothetical protein [Candidatus Parcubacteria bacterium]
MTKGHSLCPYLSEEIHVALEKERQKRGLSTKPITVARILEEYFRRKGMLPEEED